MINLGGNWDEVHWPDNWTATTVDGKRSAQFEETLLYVCQISKAHASIDRSSGSRKRVLKFLQQGSHGICSDITCSDDNRLLLYFGRASTWLLYRLFFVTSYVAILGQVSFYYSTTCMGQSVIDVEPGARRQGEKGPRHMGRPISPR